MSNYYSRHQLYTHHILTSFFLFLYNSLIYIIYIIPFGTETESWQFSNMLMLEFISQAWSPGGKQTSLELECSLFFFPGFILRCCHWLALNWYLAFPALSCQSLCYALVKLSVAAENVSRVTYVFVDGQPAVVSFSLWSDTSIIKALSRRC